MRSSRDADDIRLRLKLLRRTGAGLGLGRGRIWIRLNDSAASRRQFPQTATIEELIGINDDDMKAAYGDNWRAKAFKDDPNAKLRRGFKYASKGRGFFVSVISDKDEDKESAAPDRLAVARDDEVDKILNQVKAGYNLADRPTSRKAPSTAAPLCSKPAAGSKRKDFSGKNNGHVGAPPPSKKTKTSAAAALGSADDPRKVSPSTAKKDDIAVMHSKNVAAAKEVLSGLVGMGSNLKKVTGQKLRSAEAVPGAELEITATVEAQTTNQQGYLGREDEEFDMLGGLNDQWIDGIATELMAFVKDKIRSSDKQTAPDVLVQSVASVAISRLLEVQESTDGVFELKSTASNGRVETNKFLKIPRVRRVKTGSRAESQKKYVRKKAQFLEGLINTMSHAESASSKRLTKNIIKNLGRRFDLTVVEKDSVELAPHEVVTLRDTAGIGTNATYRFASALQALRPELDLFPPAVKAVLAMFEKTDNFDMGLELLHLQVNKDATKKRLLPFVWVKRVWHVIQSMIESSTADETFERSEDFMRPLFKGKVAVTYNIDKGGDDIMVSIRLVNRSSGNSMKFTFPIATVGGPLMENYENELESIFNEKFPIGRTLQHLCFAPKEQKKKKTVRNIEAELLEECVNESAVQFDDEESDEGLTPEVEIPVDATKLSVRLVTRQNELKTCVGVQILHEGNVIHSRRFAKAVGRTKTSLSKRWTMRAQFMQVVGFPAHDMKQQLVLAGIPSNSCKRPCPHCTEEDGNFNAKHCTTRMFNAIKRKKPSISPVAPKDPVTRTGTQWSTSACAQRYNEEVGTGTIPSRVHQSSVNERCASVTKPPLIDEHGKNSGEPTHMSMGVANKHNEKIRRYCREIDMKLPFYQLVVETSKEVEKTLRGLLSLEAKESSSALAPLHRESNKFRTELNRVLRLSEQLEKEISESDSADSRADLEDEIICLQERADDILKQCQAHSKNTQYGHLVQLQVGLLSFHDALEKFL
ncbi:hypothetical protein THAOC_09721 [Thalassiosira oceanica]|uniref:Uncharacterized protein n=1 Tax=Thalassiosira oceanica TaxID=159749 RepID=K0SUG9_THAOC|nr:hypothetical protein THAOC_09721 [Thalassiosira oceanica]|eukprot:EJK69060.1 hypothetical protein THAOC_09721 [Thalassiosira oceanica]